MATQAVSEHWILLFRKSIVGWKLMSARQRGGKCATGDDIPARVREYACLGKDGVTVEGGYDGDAGKAITAASAGRYAFYFHTSDIVRRCSARAKHGPAPVLDWDHAEYVGDDESGVYFGAVQSGGTWWCLAVVDSTRGGGGFTCDLAAEPGYSSEAMATSAARDAAMNWCHWNDVEVE